MKNSLCVFFSCILACSALATTEAAQTGAQGPKPETRTLTVRESVQLALSRAPEVLLAEAQAVRAREAVREARSLNQPQVVLGTGLAYNNGYPLSMEGAAPSIFQIGASQSIFNKKNNNLIREAQESDKAGRLGVDAAREEIAARTALVCYELHGARKAAEIARARLHNARRQQERVEVQLEAGKVRPVDVSLARTAALSAGQQLLEMEEQGNAAEAELKILTGIPDAVAIVIANPEIDSPVFGMPKDALLQRALERKPEILQAEAGLRAKEFHVEAEKGENLPKASIVSQYALFSKTNNYADYFNRFSRNNYIIGLSLQVPVFNGSRTSARVAQSRNEASEARHRLERARSDLKLSIEKSLGALRIARGASEVAKSDLEGVKEMVGVSEALLAEGRIGQSSLEEVRMQLQQKELAALEAERVLFQRKLELLRAAGSIAAELQ